MSRERPEGPQWIRKATSSLMWKIFVLHSFRVFCAVYICDGFCSAFSVPVRKISTVQSSWEYHKSVNLENYELCIFLTTKGKAVATKLTLLSDQISTKTITIFILIKDFDKTFDFCLGHLNKDSATFWLVIRKSGFCKPEIIYSFPATASVVVRYLISYPSNLLWFLYLLQKYS